jgi:hypothetical protein
VAIVVQREFSLASFALILGREQVEERVALGLQSGRQRQ